MSAVVGTVGAAAILGSTYSTVIMPDGLEWMDENLRYVGDGTVGRWWNNGASDDGDGRYYQFEEGETCEGLAVAALLTDGWRLPTGAELLTIVLLNSPNGKLVSASDGGTDAYGFDLKLGGYYHNYNDAWYSKNYSGYLPGAKAINGLIPLFNVTLSSAGSGFSRGRYPMRFVRTPIPAPPINVELFPFAPDWSRPVRDRVEYKTAILTSRNGMEQRARLRKIPRRGIEFDVSLPHGQKLDSRLWKSQGDKFGVPWWPDSVRYFGTLTAGSTSINCDCVDRLFALAPMIMVWSSPDQCELQWTRSVTDTAISCYALTRSYTNPTIMPVFVGRMDASQDLSRVTSRFTQGRVRFSCEVGSSDAAPSVPAYSPVYGNYVLEVRPDWQGPQQNARRILSRFDSGIGPVTVSDVGELSFQSQNFQWFLHGRTKAQEFRSFVDLVAGSQRPFWVPTWRQDLILSQPAASNASGFTIQACGYTSRMFPDRARRYLAIRNPSGGWIYRKALSASEIGNEETITLDAQNGVALPVGTAVSFLTLCRLAEDDAEIEWSTTEFGQATSRFIELPREVPA